MVVRRHRQKSDKCVDVIFTNDAVTILKGHINSLPDAEACGFWVMLKPRKGKIDKILYKGKLVHSLYLSPVHHKKRRETKSETTAKAKSEMAILQMAA